MPLIVAAVACDKSARIFGNPALSGSSSKTTSEFPDFAQPGVPVEASVSKALVGPVVP